MPWQLKIQAGILPYLTALQQPDSGQATNAHLKSLHMTFMCLSKRGSFIHVSASLFK